MLRRALTISTAAVFSLMIGLSSANAALEDQLAAAGGDPVVAAQNELDAAGTNAAALQALAEDIAALQVPLTPAQIAALRSIIAQAEARVPGANFAALAGQVGEGTAGVPGAPGQVADAGIPSSGTASEDASDLLPPTQASAN